MTAATGSQSPIVKMVTSGGQTGADQAGLAAAKELGIKTGGYMPLGCTTDEGPRPDMLAKYNMRECPAAGYAARTVKNVRWADATVIFGNEHSPGCALTVRECLRSGKPYIVLDFGDVEASATTLRLYLEHMQVETLNVAGNRERKNPGIFEFTKAVLLHALGKEEQDDTAKGS